MSLKDAVGAVVGVALAVIGTTADVASTVCTTSGNNSDTCQKTQDLSTASSGQDALDDKDKR